MTGTEPTRAKVIAAVRLLPHQEPRLSTAASGLVDRGTDQ